ncbi:hypothetical protein [Streptomyces umbrinus]|uniref:hypothetical protein n=1 Tax=Streptomyces umbrinus TaxID=67370 RepID=UPI0033FF215B
MAQVQNIDLLLLPHADLHVARSGKHKPVLKLDVVLRSFTDPAQKVYALESVLDPVKYLVEFSFFAPHKEPPHRLENLPKVAPDGTVDLTDADLGVYLFQVRVEKKDAGQSKIGSVVGRLQVHDQFTDWWFGNRSITTALDSQTGHAQPSIYAKFSDDRTGADLVGDITGHDYVVWTPGGASMGIAPRGRLKGLAETTTPVSLTGTFLDKTLPLSVHVVDYTKSRSTLEPVRTPDVTHADRKSNIVFLSEGFRATDRALFDKIVQQTADEMFTKPRHEPYGLLKGSFNVFKVFTPSQDQQTTCGNRVTDNNIVFGVKGVPIPSIPLFQKAAQNSYNMQQLVELVGLPKRGENRTPKLLRELWTRQGIPDLLPSRMVDDRLIEAWKAHQSDGFLQASDTMFGLHLGGRWADGSRVSTTQTLAAAVPVKDDPADPVEGPKLAKFITRLYAFYQIRPQQALTLDPRRHPPELYAGSGLPNPGNSILSFLGGLRYSLAPNPPIGKNWLPDATSVNQSRGLVAIVTYDEVDAGSAINNDTLTASTVASTPRVDFTPDSVRPELFRRTPPPPPTAANPTGIVELDAFINKAAHEFGHVFDLFDEYELAGFSDDPFEALGAGEIDADNLTSIGFLRTAPAPARTLNIDRVKWLTLPRITVSSRLSQSTIPDLLNPTHITVTVGPDEIAKWVKAHRDRAPVSLLNRTSEPNRRQLPLASPASHLGYLTGLRIIEKPDEVRGTFILNDPGAIVPSQTFREGSVVFLPRSNPNGSPSFVVEEAVAVFLRSTQLPLNPRRNLSVATRDDQFPESILGFKPPYNSFRLIGLYEGGNHASRGFYRPAGACKMRNQNDKVHDGRQFCHVCKWLLVNFIDPGQHALLDRQFYPSRPR